MSKSKRGVPDAQADQAVRTKKAAKAGKNRTVSQAETADGAHSASLSFEAALEQLEGTVARLEEGEMPLEEALELFETGVKLSRQCSGTLEAAERRIEILVADRGGALESEPFEPADDFDGEDADETSKDSDDFSDDVSEDE